MQVRFHTEEGTRGRDNMSTVGTAGPRDREQKYTYRFKGVMSTIDFDIFGGDDRDRGYKIKSSITQPSAAWIWNANSPRTLAGPPTP